MEGEKSTIGEFIDYLEDRIYERTQDLDDFEQTMKAITDELQRRYAVNKSEKKVNKPLAI
jgi:hypothetical protein